MKITFGQLLPIMQAVGKLMNQPMPIAFAYRITTVFRRLNEQMDFYTQMQIRCLKEIGASVAEDGTITYPKDENGNEYGRDQFIEKMKELNALTIEETFDPVVLPNELRMTPGECEILVGSGLFEVWDGPVPK